MDARPSGRDVILRDHDVVVAGAGVGGAAAALLLARAGARVTLLERVAEPRAVGAGILLQPNGLAVLYGLGLREALRARACVATRVDLADAQGRVLLVTPVLDFGDGLDHVVVLRRSHLQGVLLDAVAGASRITSRFGCEVMAARADGTVEWRGPGGVERMQAALVVGADGLHSRVRESGRFDVRSTAGVTYLRALVGPAPMDVMTEYWTSLGIFGAGPVDDGVYVYASTAAPVLRRALERRDLAGLRAAWAEASPVAGRLLAQVASFDDLLLNQVTRIDCTHWADGRLVLLGDAAHAMAPNLGQGANSALVDAAVLVAMLADSAAMSPALEAYERRRQPAVRWVQRTAQVLGRLGEVRAGMLRSVRDTAVRHLSTRAGSARAVRASQQEDPRWLMRVAVRGPDLDTRLRRA